MPSIFGQATKRISAILPLLLLGIALLLTDPFFTHFDDEITIVSAAAKPVAHTVKLYLSGVGEHEHPPLYDILLHGWLRITNSDLKLLRLPSILFFLAGLWALGQAAGHLAGPSATYSLLWIGALWPYGFHFGRSAGWYSFSFFLVALLTMTYLRCFEAPTPTRWAWVFGVALALTYTNYFGWALIACLTADFLWRHPERSKHFRALATVGILLLISYLSLWPVLLRLFSSGARPRLSFLATLLNGGFSLYAVTASESVAPWFWPMGMAVGIAIVVAAIWMIRYLPSAARRFLLYFILLDSALVGLGLFTTKRLMLIAPWLLLPLAVGVATPRQGHSRKWFVASLCVIASIGWYGVATRRFYAAPRFIEPWPKVADQMAQCAREGDLVIGNNPSFFFYLTYLLRKDQAGPERDFQGFLPAAVRHSGVYDPELWWESGHPVRPTTLLVKGMHYGRGIRLTKRTEEWLDKECSLQSVQQMVHDTGFSFKQRFFPEFAESPWRVEIRRYTCPGTSSP